MTRRSLFCLGRLFLSRSNNLKRNIVTSSQISHDVNDKCLKNCDETQVELMKEVCILVDEKDKKTGSASKKQCHLVENGQIGLLHRAFSVFLFNEEGDLLLQQRSPAKITYPENFTNTCCSHPLYTPSEVVEEDFTNTCCSHPLYTPSEVVEEDALGVRRAAQRKLHHELGISPQQVSVDDLLFLTRIQYTAVNQPEDGIWGENEIDYILFMQKNVDIQINKNEVKSYRYVNQKELKKFIGPVELHRWCNYLKCGSQWNRAPFLSNHRLLQQSLSAHILYTEKEKFDSSNKEGTLITPWFRRITERFLYKWWDELHNIKSQIDHQTIHRL